MKVTRQVVIELTKDEVEQAIVNFLPTRFAQKYFTVALADDGSAKAVQVPDKENQ